MSQTIKSLYDLLTKKEENHLGQITNSVLLDFTNRKDAELYFELINQLEQEIALYCAHD